MGISTAKKRLYFMGLPLLTIVLVLAYHQLLYKSPQVNSGIFKLANTVKIHTQNVWAVKFSPDGKLLASGAVDSTVKIWDKETGTVIKTFKHPAGVTNLAFSADGKYLVSSSYDGVLRLWDVNTGALVRPFSANDYTVWTLDISPDGKTIVAAGEDKKIRVWDIASGKNIQALNGHTLNIWIVKYSRDGKYLASGSFDNTVKIWDTATGKLLRTLTGHTQAVVDLAFSYDGKILATTSDDKTIKLWQVNNGKLINDLEVPEHTQAVAFSPDDKYLLTGGRDKPMIGEFLQNIFGDSQLNKGTSARLWDVKSGKILQTFRQHTNDVNDVAYSPDGRSIATASADNTVEIWNLTKLN
jgi:WD40 repeat protein